jgi:ABC-type cobalamin transport system ATPase subunit
VLLLKDGRVFACGPKKDVLTAPVLSALFGVEIGVRVSQGGVWSMHRL